MLIPGIKATTTTTGTGTVTLTAVTGFARPSDVVSDGQWLKYYLEDGNNKEWGYGKAASGNTFSRDLILATFASGTWAWYPGTGISLSGSATFSCEQVEGGAGDYIGHARGFTGSSTQYGVAGMKSAYGVLGSATQTANYILAYPFETQEFMKITELGGIVATASSGAKFRFGIYAPRPFGNATTAALIGESGELDAATTGFKSATGLSIIVPPGQYLAAFTTNNSSMAMRTHQQQSAPAIALDSSNVLTWMLRKTSGFTYGAMPSTLDLSTFGLNNASCPAMMFKRN